MSCINKRIFLRERKLGRRPANFPLDSGNYPMRITRRKEIQLAHISKQSIELLKKPEDVACIAEMMTLFECFNLHDYDRNKCQQQAQNLENCYTKHMISKRDHKERVKKLANSK